jgi:hypothetical protein
MKTRWRAHFPSIVTLAGAAAPVAYGPIPQLANYHDFADERVLLGIPHWGDVVSNVGFAVIAAWGLWLLPRFHGAGRLGYGVFLVSLLLTSIGSSFYHWAPDTDRLVWDRLPIALACAGLLAAVRSESKPRSNGLMWTVCLAMAAVASVLWWHIIEQSGQGDLRPYLLLQGLPLILIPLWQAQAYAPQPARVAVGVAIALYVAAKLAEINDHLLYLHLGVISGHTLKHLLATMAVAALVVPLAWRSAARTRPAHRLTPAPINS